MIKVSFHYPDTGNSRFDIEYYTTSHLRLARELFGDALLGISIDRGIAGIMPGSAPPFHAVGHLLFDSVERFYEAVMPNVDQFRADAAKYTDVEPVIFISETVEL